MAEDKVEFEDIEGGVTFSKEDISIRIIVLNHLKKICLLSCDEFIGGYYNSVTEWHGELRYVKKVYVPDARARYIQAVDSLYDILIPFFDTQFSKEKEEIQKMPSDNNDKKLEKTRKLFQELNKLLLRKNYLAE